MRFSFHYLLQRAGPTLHVSHCGHPLGFGNVWEPLVKHLIFLPIIPLHQPKGTSRNLQIYLAVSCCSSVSPFSRVPSPVELLSQLVGQGPRSLPYVSIGI